MHFGQPLHQSQAQALLVTRGKDGMSLFHPPQEPVHIPAQAREVFDVTGAGDTGVATFSMALLSGLSLLEAARLANTAAGVVSAYLALMTDISSIRPKLASCCPMGSVA